jgi:histidinol-phosphate phosphatase family protein
MNWLTEIDCTWNLFLDRDGVLNKEITGDYVRTPEQLEIYPEVPVALAHLLRKFDMAFIITNQRCIGRGIITEDELHLIHNKLLDACYAANASIEKIYFSPHLENDHPMRKPQVGMGLQAKKEYPEINFEKSVMIGNSPSDILFGKNLGMKTIYVTTTQPGEGITADLILANVAALVPLLGIDLIGRGST